MKEKRYLIDSNIIIYHLNDESIATEFLLQNFQSSAISRITFMEILSFDFTPDAQKVVIEYLEQFTIIDTNRDIAMQVIENRKLKRIKLPDNIIASTAQIYDLMLVTRNEKDFRALDIRLLNPFEKEPDENIRL